MLAKTIDTDHGGVLVLVLNIWGNGAHTDAHGPDEHEGILLFPFLANICALNDCGTQLSFQRSGYLAAGLAHLYNGYLLHFSIVIG